ncbi:hypothetical protein B0O80DRAFT_468718 [Mortierella sp. GBAus27b]|nr:hypothetical protein B0O80DRAFT_468718 [Mortierella sp. GBAus27b]
MAASVKCFLYTCTCCIPGTSRICSNVTPPGLRIAGGTRSPFTTVDSIPKLHCPQLITMGIFPCRSSMTCDAKVGEGFPEELAEGAASGMGGRRPKSGSWTATVAWRQLLGHR